MTVEEGEIGATAVEVGVDVILLSHTGQTAVVEEPNNQRWARHRSKFALGMRAAPVHMVIEAVMEQIGSIAAARICRADPEAASRLDG